MKNQSISSIQNSGRSHKSISKTQEHETKQGKWITRSKGGSQNFFRILGECCRRNNWRLPGEPQISELTFFLSLRLYEQD